MAFTIYGPGIRDSVTLDTLFKSKVVEHAQPAQAIQPAASQDGADGEPSSSYTGSEARRAYQQTAAYRDRAPALHAHQIMTAPVITLGPTTSIVQAWRLFRERRFRHIPVVDDQQAVIGIVSDRDLLRYAALSGKIPPYSADAPEARTPIKSLTKTRVLTATPDTEIRQIARILFEQRIGAMPIVNDVGYPVGIITRSDILRALIQHAPLELWV